VEKDARLPLARRLKLIKSNSVSAPDSERDYVFLKHERVAKFIPSSEIDKRRLCQDESSDDSGLTMKARAERLVTELFLQPSCTEILASECYKRGEERGISGEILKRAMRELGVDNRKGADGLTYRYWPMRDFFFDQPTVADGNDEKVIAGQHVQLPIDMAQPIDQDKTNQHFPSDIYEIEKDCPVGTPRAFQSIFIAARDVSDNTDAIRLRVKRGASFLDFVIEGEVAKRFKTAQEQHCIQVGQRVESFQLMSGSRVTLQVADDDIYRQIQANSISNNVENPVWAIEFWPRLRKAT